MARRRVLFAVQVDIRIRVKGGGHTAQIYAIRQAIAKSIVAYYQKCTSPPMSLQLPASNIMLTPSRGRLYRR